MTASTKHRPRVSYQKAADWVVIQVGGAAMPAGAFEFTDMPHLWTSADGRYSCLAVRVESSAESVTLKRMVDGQVVTVPLSKLSEADRLLAQR
jgi:hypothetical protein